MCSSINPFLLLDNLSDNLPHAPNLPRTLNPHLYHPLTPTSQLIPVQKILQNNPSYPVLLKLLNPSLPPLLLLKPFRSFKSSTHKDMSLQFLRSLPILPNSILKFLIKLSYLPLSRPPNAQPVTPLAGNTSTYNSLSWVTIMLPSCALSL